MAAEQKIKELFELAKTSKFFAGLQEKDIWKACQDYADRSDEEVDGAMARIKDEDAKIIAEENAGQAKLKEKQQQALALKKQEVQQRAEDMQTADQLLEKLFK